MNGGIVAVVFVFSLYKFVQAGGGGSIDENDSTGNRNSSFIEGTPFTDKITSGIQCVKNDTVMSVTLLAHENDINLNFTSNGQQVRFEECIFLDANELKNGWKNETDCPLTVINSTGTEAGQRTRMYIINNLPATGPASNIECGGMLDGDKYVFVVRCSRNATVDSQFDTVVQLECDRTDPTQYSNVLLSDNTKAGVPQSKDVQTEYNATMSIHNCPNDTYNPQGSNPVTTAKLGDSLCFMLCIAIESDQLFFFNGYSVMSIIPDECYVTVENEENLSLRNKNYNKTFVSQNCGTGNLPISIPADKNAVYYLNDGLDGTVKDYLRSPNCFRSPSWEAVSPHHGKVGEDLTLNLTCAVRYGLTVDGIEFGKYKNGSQYSSDYDYTCPGPDRRRRSDDDEDVATFNLPNSLTAQYTVTLPGNEKTDKEAAKRENVVSGCFEKSAFLALTSVLGVLLILVLCTAVFLALKLKSAANEEHGSSMSGFKNKAYE